MLLPVNCKMSEWGQCSASCGEGATKTRTKLIEAKNGGTECPQQHVTESCILPACRGKF